MKGTTVQKVKSRNAHNGAKVVNDEASPAFECTAMEEAQTSTEKNVTRPRKNKIPGGVTQYRGVTKASTHTWRAQIG